MNWNKFNNSNTGYNSMYNYFKEASYEQLELPSTFYPEPPTNIILSYQDSHERSYFMPYNATTNPNGYQNGDQRRDREHILLKDAVNWVNANSPVPESLDLDYDENGTVDNVVFVVRGGTTAWATLLWPHRWVLYSQEAYINGKRVWDYNFQLETHMNSSGNGVLCHEMGHSLGAPDLYHYTGNGITPTGPWDLMESNSNPPQYMGAYMKKKYMGWIDSIPEITEPGTYTLFPLQNAENNSFKIRSINTIYEFFVVEFRKKEGTFESSLPNSGMLVYRIDTTAGNGNAGGPPDEVFLFRPGGSPSTNGVINSAQFGDDYGRTEINDDTDPACFLQNGQPGGLYISEISAVGDSMTFFVDFPGPPEAEFSASKTMDCPGGIVSFTDESLHIPDTWEWIFEPATVSFVNGTTANSEDPEVQFNENGMYTVTLVASNEFDADTITKTGYIEIGSFQTPFWEDFESQDFATQSWFIENPDGEYTWQFAEVNGNAPGHTAAMLNFREYFSIGERDRLISPPVSLEGMSVAYLNFEHAYAQYAAQATDSLIVYISNDCGQNWTRLKAMGEDGSGSFATHPLTTDGFVPEVGEDWCFAGFGASCNSINISDWIGSEPVKVMFETYSLFGNPLYIDNIQIAQTVDVAEHAESEFTVNIYPNPSQGVFTLDIRGMENASEVNIFNIHGKLVKSFIAGKNLEVIDLGNLSEGMYFIRIAGGDRNVLEKIMVQ
ncbi:MAG: M6 family metalloprotease domain-containing protein [Bacteroidota bacterium]|nr:M6 family metalloprotease domain-containing protein [Bacteroidota bacterium]